MLRTIATPAAHATASTTAAPAMPSAPKLPVPTPPQDWNAPDVVAARNAAGRAAEFEDGVPRMLPGEQAAAPKYFRTFEQVRQAMTDLAAKYPTLARVEDIGDSGDKLRGTAPTHDILALRLTAAPKPGREGVQGPVKPKVLWIGGTHAREIANPELLLQYATRTLGGYGTDPEATALLDTRELLLVPIANPDGHATVEQGYATKDAGKLWQRKNTTPPAGTDLNRNYEYKWGQGGASSSPASETYRGAGPASEGETQAIENFARREKPSLIVDWHSYSRLNLYPWGYTAEKAPDEPGLKALAEKFSTFNHYTPEPSVELYVNSGSSKDWGYGELHVPAFTIETGDDFHQSDAQYAESWAQNSPVMDWIGKAADAPYDRVKGPDTLAVDVTRPSAAGSVQLSATVRASAAGASRVDGAELTLDPFSAPGSGTALTPRDGAFDAASEVVTGELAGATPGQLVYVRARDAAGNWGPATPQWTAGPATSTAPTT